MIDIQQEKTFNPNSHIIQISSSQGKKDYLPVQYRLVWLRSLCPDAEITTELLHLDMDKEVEHETTKWNDEKRKYEKVILHGKGVAVFKATVKTPTGAVATGTKSENNAAFADYIEKAETGAIGRALAALGYGTQFTGDELDEGNDRIADAPVQRSAPQPIRESKSLEGAILDTQVEALVSMYGKLKKTMPNVSDWTAQQAADEIKRLMAEWRQLNQKAS